MQKKNILSVLLTVFAVFFSVSFFSLAFAQTDTPIPTTTQNTSALQDQIRQYEQKISDLQGQEKSLSSQIAIMDNQVKLTEARIADTKVKIANLEKDIEITKGKVKGLEKNINFSTKALLGRIAATYQVGSSSPWEIFLTSNNITNFFTRLKYLRIVQVYDKKTIYAAEQAKNDYNNQKTIFEDKQKEQELLSKKLEDYTKQLGQEKKSKQTLLNETRGSEANYQVLLAQARAEYLQIQGIVAGKGTEGEIGQVNKGDVIATIIQGASCNSSGAHLHFTVSRDGSAENPFNYLKPVDYTNDSGGDGFNPSGSWDWPIDPPIELHQGYGDTWYVRTYRFYPSHNGIDITGSSFSVKAVKSGTLFQGNYTGNGGCRLRYVRVHQSDDGLDTFYLHINYVH